MHLQKYKTEKKFSYAPKPAKTELQLIRKIPLLDRLKS